MRKLSLLLLLSLLSGCASAPVAGKSLLAIKQEILAVRTAVGVPCQNGTIPQDACKQIDALYKQAGPIYDSAVDAEILALRSSDPNSKVDLTQLMQLDSELVTLAAKYGLKGGN
jgi:hypothetical protein